MTTDKHEHHVEQLDDINGPAWRAFCVSCGEETPYHYSFLPGIPRHPGLRALAELKTMCGTGQKKTEERL